MITGAVRSPLAGDLAADLDARAGAGSLRERRFRAVRCSWALEE